MSVRLDKEKDKLLESYAIGMLKDFYLTEYETSPQEAFIGRRKNLSWFGYILIF